MENPVQGITIGIMTGGISAWSFCTILETGTTVFAFLGAFFGGITAMAHFFFVVRRYWRFCRVKRRRKTDKKD